MKTKLKNFSASQAKSFKTCQRKWAFEKLLKLPGNYGKGAAKGTAIHSQLEKYTNERVHEDTLEVHGERFPVRPYVDAAKDIIHALTTPKTEHFFKIHVDLPVPCIGYIDLHQEPPHATVYDWKTTISLNYAPTSYKLYRDDQARIYAKAYREMYKHDDIVKVKFFYMETKNKTKVRSKLVETEYTPEEIEKHWESLCKTFVEMYEIARDVDPEVEAIRAMLDPNLDACTDFGGCPYREPCRPDEG